MRSLRVIVLAGAVARAVGLGWIEVRRERERGTDGGEIEEPLVLFCIVANPIVAIVVLLFAKKKKLTSRRASPWLPAPEPRRRGGSRSSWSSLGGLRLPFLEQREGKKKKKKKKVTKNSRGGGGGDQEAKVKLGWCRRPSPVFVRRARGVFLVFVSVLLLVYKFLLYRQRTQRDQRQLRAR